MNAHVFVQSEVLKDIAVLGVDDQATLAQLRKACESLLPAGVDPSQFRMYLEDDDEGDFDPQQLIAEGLRVHLHRLKAIDVHVRYAGRDVRRTFRPSATIRRIKRWSVREFGITTSDAKELMLQVSGTEIRPDEDVHVGSLVAAPRSAITFDLVPSPRING
ncbi:hypothetical protein AB4Y64_13235 [Lysobacter sp. TAF61]|uniref:hypothetical protein n=1 Tax=Lysobacter sp. TAF61 TaxID=3233072 RepID=UPI003F995FCD